MLRRIERINREDFRVVFPKTTLFHTPHLLVRVFVPGKGVSRGAVVVSKRVIKKATERNKVKRKIYNILKEVFDTFPTNTSVDLIVFAKKGVGGLSYVELEKEVFNVLSKISPKQGLN